MTITPLMVGCHTCGVGAGKSCYYSKTPLDEAGFHPSRSRYAREVQAREEAKAAEPLPRIAAALERLADYFGAKVKTCPTCGRPPTIRRCPQCGNYWPDTPAHAIDCTICKCRAEVVPNTMGLTVE